MSINQTVDRSVSTKQENYNILLSFTTFLLKGCLTDYYKNIVGDEACHKCPGGKTNNTMHTKCKCKKDHYIGHNESGPCYGMYPNHYNYGENRTV
jgi:hypothetical protein